MGVSPSTGKKLSSHSHRQKMLTGHLLVSDVHVIALCDQGGDFFIECNAENPVVNPSYAMYFYTDNAVRLETRDT